MKNSRITFIGCGNMGRSLIGGLIANGLSINSITGTDVNAEQRETTASQFNIEVLEDNQQAIKDADVVVLAVKPQSMQDTLQSIKAELAQEKPLLISIAAGIHLSDLGKWAGEELAIVRSMPNTPALIQSGATALCANQYTSDSQRDLAEAIMRSVGLALWLDDETLMDAVTALSGSGPAYYFLIMEVMEKAATQLGLSQEHARILTLQTAFGAAKMALESNHDTETLRKQVTSPGGTTEQALNVLMNGGIEELFADALKAAQKRSTELAASLGGK
ncbi:MAG: pyrroline-5-carboxylate reductase [Gammaproteobacteria bacterium]|nr:pyrroline-5-carboxylate reductase [Gammaproteobacteria bacterium]